LSVAFRIIPKLDIKGPNLVKGINLEGLRVLGKPEDYAKFYYEQGADELIYQDVVASLYGRNSLVDIVSRTAKEIFIPLTVGGGIKDIDDISTILKAGADKVSINTGAIANPKFISKAVSRFGSSTILVAIEAISQENGEHLAFTDNGRNSTNRNVVDWAIEVEKLGVGEILITSVNKEGTGDGFDRELVSEISDNVSIPVIAHGGAGKKDHVLDIKKELDLSGVAISSLFHYDFINLTRKLEGYEDEGNTTFLSSFRKFKKVEAISILELKRYLSENSILLRTIN
tara:strand:- start:771 stop:1628 length:858 start_codon:yes stop_codon:yes gene_type:complete